MLMSLLGALLALMYLAVAVILAGKYRRTHDAGFLWLGAAIFVWPPLASLIHDGEHRLLELFSRGQLSWFIPVTLIDYRQVESFRLVSYLDGANQIVNVGLLLLAVSSLCNSKSKHRLAS